MMKLPRKTILIPLTFLTEVSEDEDNKLFQWDRLLYLDDDIRNLDPRITAHARQFGVDVE